jgi:hypothetical protein
LARPALRAGASRCAPTRDRRPEVVIGPQTPTAGPARSRYRRDAVIVGCCAAVVVAVLAWAATRSGDTGSGAGTPPVPTGGTSVDTAAPAELDDREPFTRDGVETTVLLADSLEDPTPTGPMNSWYGVRIQRCPEAGVDDADAGWSAWSISDGTTSVAATELVPPDGLVDQVYPVGKDGCDIGWILLDVPTAVAEGVEQVSLSQDGTVVASWAVG